MFGLFKRNEKYFSDTEYWIYVPGATLPSQDALMDFVISGSNEFGVKGSIGRKEGILFSDIRLSVALVLRTKNPHLFRPDLIGDNVAVTKELLEGLAASPSLIKIRYTSEDPLKDTRHLHLLPNLAVAAGCLAHAVAIYDVETNKLFDFQEFKDELSKNPDPARPDFHVRSVWKPFEHGFQAESRGLVKVGLRDFATKGMNADEQVLVTTVVEETARQLFATARYPESLVIESFGDKFKVLFDLRAKGLVRATILRMQETA